MVEWGGGGGGGVHSPASAGSARSSPGRWRQIGGLWRGASATLWRDVPYSGLYWTSVEFLRAQLGVAGSVRPGDKDRVGRLLLAGGLSGAWAAGVTTPMDVIKTRMQLEHPLLPTKTNTNTAKTTSTPRTPRTNTTSTSTSTSTITRIGTHMMKRHGIRETARILYQEGGLGAFYTGWGPRSLRAAPACAIVLGTYEGMKGWLADALS